jgi:hypothetical protein
MESCDGFAYIGFGAHGLREAGDVRGLHHVDLDVVRHSHLAALPGHSTYFETKNGLVIFLRELHDDFVRLIRG